MLGLREAERRRDLALARVEDQAGDLGVAVDGGELGARQGVEEVDAAVVAAAAGGDERGLPWGEGDCFAGGVQGEGVFLFAGGDTKDFALAAGGVVAVADIHGGGFDGCS